MALRWLLALGALLFVAACATLDEDACRAGNWQAIGFKDGTNGRSPGYLNEHREACARFGIAPNPVQWEAGRQQGLPQYCTISRAWREGSNGRHLRPVCTGETLAALQDANERGLIWNRIERDIRDAERRISEIDADLGKLPSDDPTRIVLTGERAQLRLEILRLRARQMRFRA